MAALISIPILASGLWALPLWRVEFAFALVGAVLAAWTAYHARVSHFLECFSRCNKSYARLNGQLGLPSRLIHASGGPIADERPSDAILDYFNLCAEEYLMQKMGVIPDFVWDVWLSGIHDCAHQDHIKAAWDSEMKANCNYYGFDLRKLMRKHHVLHAGECGNRKHCLWGEDFSETALGGDE